MIQIAIVDDESRQIKIIQQSIQKFFRQKNRADDYRIDTFHSGESLLLSSRLYDLIFLDIQMNGMDGIETAKKIRTWDRKVCVMYVSNGCIVYRTSIFFFTKTDSTIGHLQEFRGLLALYPAGRTKDQIGVSDVRGTDFRQHGGHSLF